MPRSTTTAHRALDEAAAWFARQRLDSWSPVDAREFAEWLKADATHPRAWASYDQLWKQLDSVRDDPKILAIRERARHNASRNAALARLCRFGGAVLAASVVLAIAVVWNVRAPVRTASTDIGERSILMLPDGSRVTLNTVSAVNVDYTSRTRRVVLTAGEAFFEVAKDPARPFVVSAGSRQVIAVGTTFDVRLQDHQVKVTLVEGKVRVLTASTPPSTPLAHAPAVAAVTLEPGSTLIAKEGGIDRIEHIDVTRVTSWREGRLVFEGERLAEVVAEMNRYSREKLEIATPALADRRVSGVFEPTNGAALAKALETYGIARVARRNEASIVLEAPQ